VKFIYLFNVVLLKWEIIRHARGKDRIILISILVMWQKIVGGFFIKILYNVRA